jgi:outer membrane protein assembly factor BamB
MRKVQSHLISITILLTALVNFIYGYNTPANSTEKIELNKKIIKWTYPVKGHISYATLKGEKIYFQDANNLIYIVSTKGNLMKVIDPGTKICWGDPPILITENELLIAIGGRVYCNRVFIFDKSGEIKGKLISYNSDNFEKILYKNKTVFCLLNDHPRLAAVEIDSNGKIIRKKWVKEDIISPVQLSSNGVIYAIKEEEIPRSLDVNWKLVAIDTSNGLIKYECFFPDIYKKITEFVTDNEDNIIINTIDSIYKLDKHCHIQWKYKGYNLHGVYSSSNTIYLINDQINNPGNLIAIDSTTGKEKWILPLHHRNGKFVVKDGQIYFISRKHLYIIDAEGNIKWDVFLRIEDPLEYESIVGIGNDGTIYLQMSIDTWTDGLFAISIPK